MAHFAKVNANNVVENVVVVDNIHMFDENMEEVEQNGIDWLQSLFGANDEISWVQTSYNDNFRNMYAFKGCIWQPEKNRFIEPQPHESFVWDEDRVAWVIPEKPSEDLRGTLWELDLESGTWVVSNNYTILKESGKLDEDALKNLPNFDPS